MKISIAIILFSVFLSGLNGQEATKSRTGSGYVSITKDPPKPPYIEIVPGSLAFSDPDGNQMINANESAKIIFSLKNSGQGPGLNLNAKLAEKNSVPGLTLSQTKALGTLDPGKTIQVEIPVTGTMNTTDTKASFSIAIDEANGFGTDPVIIEVPVKAFVSPMIKIVDYKVTSQSGTTIEKKKPFEVQVLVQNVGQGKAENITVSVVLPDPVNMFITEGNALVDITNLAAGEQKLIDYSFVANNNYAAGDIKLNFLVKERYNKYAENKSVVIAMNQKVASEKLVVQGKTEEAKKFEIGSLTSSIDKNIPFNAAKNPNRIALIIGNEDYSGNLNAEINVAFAVNDATVFKQYAVNTMGVPEENVIFKTNATAGEMRKNIDLTSRLLEKMGPQSELIFYYAGHGLPDEATKVPYLIPVDVEAGNLTAAIKLSDVYSQFGKSGAGRVTVFLDACFSGGGRSQGLLAARGVKIVPKVESIVGNMVVFAASSEDQSALPLNRERHGLFTYFLLKKLQETSGNITYEQLAESVRKDVSVESLRVNSKEQDPVVNISKELADKWKTWKIN
jgi:hypothetical protein